GFHRRPLDKPILPRHSHGFGDVRYQLMKFMRICLMKSLLRIVAILTILFALQTTAKTLGLTIDHRWNEKPLVFDALTQTTAIGQSVSVTRLDYLLSGFSLRQT